MPAKGTLASERQVENSVGGTVRVFTPNHSGHTLIERSYPGWPGSGFARKLVQLSVRHVDGAAQIELAVRTDYASGADRTALAGMELDAGELAAFIAALTIKAGA